MTLNEEEGRRIREHIWRLSLGSVSIDWEETGESARTRSNEYHTSSHWTSTSTPQATLHCCPNHRPTPTACRLVRRIGRRNSNYKNTNYKNRYLFTFFSIIIDRQNCRLYYNYYIYIILYLTLFVACDNWDLAPTKHWITQIYYLKIYIIECFWYIGSHIAIRSCQMVHALNIYFNTLRVRFRHSSYSGHIFCIVDIR